MIDWEIGCDLTDGNDLFSVYSIVRKIMPFCLSSQPCVSLPLSSLHLTNVNEAVVDMRVSALQDTGFWEEKEFIVAFVCE